MLKGRKENTGVNNTTFIIPANVAMKNSFIRDSTLNKATVSDKILLIPP